MWWIFNCPVCNFSPLFALSLTIILKRECWSCDELKKCCWKMLRRFYIFFFLQLPELQSSCSNNESRDDFIFAFSRFNSTSQAHMSKSVSIKWEKKGLKWSKKEVARKERIFFIRNWFVLNFCATSKLDFIAPFLCDSLFNFTSSFALIFFLQEMVIFFEFLSHFIWRFLKE